MNKFIALAVAIAAIATVTGTETSAQTFNKGYQFGTGIRAAGGFGHYRGINNAFGLGVISRGVSRQVRPPYFAEYPPVYYNGIVRRPYGISPYAAPAGIAPVEMQVSPVQIDPVTVTNPFFNKSQPVTISDSVEEKVELETKNKSTRVANPHFTTIPESFGPTMHASFEVFEQK